MNNPALHYMLSDSSNYVVSPVGSLRLLVIVTFIMILLFVIVSISFRDES